MKYSIIIPTYKRKESLRQTISSIFSNCNYLNEIEIIIVDNDNGCSAKEIAEAFIKDNLKYVVEETSGVSYARNKGASIALSDNLVFIDDDEIITKLWFIEILNYLNEDFLVGSVNLKYLEQPPFWVFGSLENYLSKINYDKNRELSPKEWISAGNIMIKKELFFKIGGFKTISQRTGSNLLGNEDIMLKKDAENLDIKIKYIHNLVVEHIIPSERLRIDWFLKRAEGQGISNANFDKYYQENRVKENLIKYYLCLIFSKLTFLKKKSIICKIILKSKEAYLKNIK